jgi:hypothetical protein
MIFVIVNNKDCIGYCTTIEKAIEEVNRNIQTKHKVDEVIVETNHNETKFEVYKKYINMNTYPKDIKCLESCYIIYKADFLS